MLSSLFMPNSKHRKSLIRFEFPVITGSDKSCSSVSIDIRFGITDLYVILWPNCRNRSVKFHIYLFPSPSRTPYKAKIPIHRIPVVSSFGKQAEFRTYGINIHNTATKFHIDSHHQFQQTDFFFVVPLQRNHCWCRGLLLHLITLTERETHTHTAQYDSPGRGIGTS
jgi:hypothetical protein